MSYGKENVQSHWSTHNTLLSGRTCFPSTIAGGTPTHVLLTLLYCLMEKQQCAALYICPVHVSPLIIMFMKYSACQES